MGNTTQTPVPQDPNAEEENVNANLSVQSQSAFTSPSRSPSAGANSTTAIPTQKTLVITLIENHPVGALVIILFSIATAILSAATDILDFNTKRHRFYGAPELADQYYALIPAKSPGQAKRIRKELIELSVISRSYKLADEIMGDQGRMGFLSSDVMIGFDPDQIVYARNPEYRGEWIVGIDLQPGQGSLDETASEIAKIHRVMGNIPNEFREDSHPLRQALSRSESKLLEMTESYYSVADYEDKYGLRIPEE